MLFQRDKLLVCTTRMKLEQNSSRLVNCYGQLLNTKTVASPIQRKQSAQNTGSVVFSISGASEAAFDQDPNETAICCEEVYICLPKVASSDNCCVYIKIFIKSYWRRLFKKSQKCLKLEVMWHDLKSLLFSIPAWLVVSAATRQYVGVPRHAVSVPAASGSPSTGRPRQSSPSPTTTYS